MMPKRRLVTAELAAEIRQLHASGLSYKAVGVALGLHWTTIRDYVPPALRRVNPQSNIDRLQAIKLYTEQGWSLTRICDLYRCKIPTLKKTFGPGFEYRDGNMPSPALDLERAARRAEKAPPPKPVVVKEKPPAIDYRDPRVVGVLHLIDFKRAGHTAAWYRQNCEISELEDMRERRRFSMQPRAMVAGFEERFA